MNRVNKKSCAKLEGYLSADYEIISSFANTKKRTDTVGRDLLNEICPNFNADDV